MKNVGTLMMEVHSPRFSAADVAADPECAADGLDMWNVTVTAGSDSPEWASRLYQTTQARTEEDAIRHMVSMLKDLNLTGTLRRVNKRD